MRNINLPYFAIVLWIGKEHATLSGQITSFFHMSLYRSLFFLFFSVGFINPGSAQQKKQITYPSLLWQITGNGLKRPSYLFGTMHVSSKMAFHLSDSFYYALKSVDAVALELNPEVWQPQMIRLNDLNKNYASYVQEPGNDYLTENTFRISKYEDLLKSSLNSEPPVVNSLLYRTYQTKADFEEDTFLDLYIFQTGRKLGKAPAGVEDYYESEKLVLEAYTDMSKEKKKKDMDLDGETMSGLVEKMQNAYRRGDLDLMDSLDNMMESSVAFREKFLYKRNEIQANSIDSIIRKRSLFAGVGAAHLPGNRGVIKLLRDMGYTLRPIKMADRDANQKDNIDKLRVKVNFNTQLSPDGAYTVDVPGQLYALGNAYLPLDRSQYADMNNGSYYLVTRVKTYASFLGQSQKEVQNKVDSLLYENIPGRILSKKIIQNNGYPGFDISNRTRRGDRQRYQIFITPFEVITFKMSGKDDYVAGEEAARFFGSIRLKKEEAGCVHFAPVQKGFSIDLPQPAHQYFDDITNNRWEYEARDSTNQEAYLILKKSIYNYNFIEADTFDLSMVEESFRNPDYFGNQLSRRHGTVNGYPGLFVREQLKTGEFVNAVYVIKGPDYYAFARRTNDAADTGFSFINSVRWEKYQYPLKSSYIDSFLHFSLATPVRPELDEGIRQLIEKSAQDASNGLNSSGFITYWQKQKNALLKSDSTGEMVSVQLQEYPKYFYIEDSVKFWDNEISNFAKKNDLFLRNRKTLALPGGMRGYRFALTDTGSSRMIERMIILKDNYLYSIASISDTLSGTSAFVNDIFNSFSAYKTKLDFNPFETKLTVFFRDLFSQDSALHNKAQQAIGNLYYGVKGTREIYNAIQRLRVNDKDYFDSKARLIAELGFIKDSSGNSIPALLKTIYDRAEDTTLFQNEAIKALARLRTAAAFKVLKEIMLQDPPVFNDDNDYDIIFSNLEDSLALSAALFPDLLKLSTLSDYKEPVLELLVRLADSGFVKPKNYKRYLSSIFIDAKVAQKKQRAIEEKKMQDDKKKLENDNSTDVGKDFHYNNTRSGLNDYSVLLIPFYDKDKHVKQYFSRLLESKDERVKMAAAIILLRNRHEVNDSIFNKIAADARLTGKLYSALESIHRLDKFPAKYKSQLSLARSFLLAENEYNKMDSVLILGKTVASVKGITGNVFFFKYRVKKTDDWKMGLSGLQPLDENLVTGNNILSILTDKKFKEFEPIEPQFQQQLKRILFGYHQSGRKFFNTDDSNSSYKSLSDYED